MTVESVSAQNTSRPAATEAKHARVKPGDAYGQGSGGPGGFMTILASLDTSDLAVPVATDITLPSHGPGAIAVAALQRAPAALSGVTGEAPPVDLTDAHSDVGVPMTEADLAQLLKGEEFVLDPSLLPPPIDVPRQPELLVDAAALLVQPELPADTTALLAQAAQWNVAAVASPEQVNPKPLPPAPSNPAGVGRPLFGAEKPEGTALAHAALGEMVSELAGKAGKAHKEVAERLAAAQAALADPVSASSQVAESRQAQAVQKVLDTPLNPVVTALTAAFAATPGRREDMVRERSVFRSTVPDAMAPVQTYTPATTTGLFANAPAPVTSMETYVAEKVAYWISNDVQNAEMKLDGIGELPVEVSIRMQGNEAHIAFRSDELHARAALENASEHLKDMLQREGLVLSGVSVGTAGAGDPGGQERKSRQGARQAGVASVQPAPTDSVTGSRRSTGGAVDLFV